MKHAIMIIIASLSLAGCNRDRSSAEDAVRIELKDPESVRFGEYKQVLSKDRDWACLGVNAKNSFGGYTGEQSARFVRKAGAETWTFDSIAPQSFAECLKMLHDMQPYEGGAR